MFLLTLDHNVPCLHSQKRSVGVRRVGKGIEVVKSKNYLFIFVDFLPLPLPLVTLRFAKSTTAMSTGSVNNFSLQFCTLGISFKTLGVKSTHLHGR